MHWIALTSFYLQRVWDIILSPKPLSTDILLIFQQFQPLTTGDRFGLIWNSNIPNCEPHLVQIVIKRLTTALRSPLHMSCSHLKASNNIKMWIGPLFPYDFSFSSCSVNYYSNPFYFLHLPVFLVPFASPNHAITIDLSSFIKSCIHTVGNKNVAMFWTIKWFTL